MLIAAVSKSRECQWEGDGHRGTFQTSTLGQRMFAVTAVGRDNAGNLVSSDWTKCQGTFQVPPSAPSSLAGSVQ